LSLGPIHGRSTEGDESARESKHTKVGDDGQSDEENNGSEEEENNGSEVEENHESEEEEHHESEEEDHDDLEEPVILKAVSRRRSTRSNTQSKKSSAHAPAPTTKRRPIPVLAGKLLEKRKPKHGRNYEVVNLKKMRKVDYIVKRNIDHYHE
jgi:hypothetical protein